MMQPASSAKTKPVRQASIRFGAFEFDPTTLELFRRGSPVPLARQPALLLGELLAHEGELVSRDQISERLWPAGRHVEVDLGINNAVRRLRRALGDSAREPTYIETLTGRGYRFSGPLNVPRAHPPGEPPEFPTPLGSKLVRGRPKWRVLALLSLAVVVVTWSLISRVDEST